MFLFRDGFLQHHGDIAEELQQEQGQHWVGLHTKGL